MSDEAKRITGASSKSKQCSPVAKLFLFYRQLQKTDHGAMMEYFRPLTYRAIND
ncbi:MAG: hypothetical protein IPK57_10070 [Chitinophagaceae bacterium]|nr:hypothetical protein [Chitinophagaceae bacterium]